MTRNQTGFLWLAIGVVFGIIATVLGWNFPREDKPPLIGALDWTGRLAFFIFLLPFCARPLRTLVRTNVTQPLMRWRRNSGILYGAVQSVHLVLIILMFSSMDDPPVLPGMTEGGGIGLLLCMAMLVTSFDRTQRALGPVWWRRLHRSGMYVFAFIYIYEFVMVPYLNNNWAHFELVAVLICAAVLLRLIAWARTTAGRSAAAT